jgi:hypothetical protein
MAASNRLVRKVFIRGQRSEVRDQKSEIRNQRSEVRGQKSEIRSQRSEVIRQRSEVRIRDRRSGLVVEFLTSDF